MTVGKTEQDLRDAAQGLQGILRRAFARGGEDYEPSPMAGLDMKTYKALLALAENSDDPLAQAQVGHIMKNAILQRAEKEKDATRRAYDQILKDSIEKNSRAIDEQIRQLQYIARYHREEEEKARIRREQALDNLEKYRKIKEGIDDAFLDSDKKLDREKAKKTLEAAGVKVPEDATDEQIRQLLLNTSDDYAGKIKIASDEYNEADELSQTHRAEAEKYEKMAQEILDRREKIRTVASSDEDYNSKLKELYEETKDTIDIAKAKIGHEEKISKDLDAFANDAKKAVQTLESKEKPTATNTQTYGPGAF